VLDRPSADEDFLKALHAKTKLVVFDDSMHLKSYRAHAIINPGLHAHLLEYPADGHAGLFLGTEFAPLPPEFDGFQDFRCSNPGRARHILAYFRGRDRCVEAVRLLKSVAGQFSATLISTDLSRGEELAQEIGIDPRFVVLREGGIGRRLSSCDLALTGPESLCEPALFALPTALIGESPVSDYAAKNGLALSLGPADSLDGGCAVQLEALLSDKPARDRMSARLSELVDGLGRFRLAEGLLGVLQSP
jgi:spore coat polysaccharide biosynthesis predicted glycosyltransferase SpsG